MRKVTLLCEKCKRKYKMDIVILKACGYFWKCEKCGTEQYFKPVAKLPRIGLLNS